jgi:3-hydroxyacyl-CoA dehydrogenase
VGLDQVFAAVERFHRQHGEFWTPSALLKKLALEGGRFNPVRAPGAA